MEQSGEKWVILMFMGEYHHTIDEKGRLTIPSKVREDLGVSFVLTRGLDGCLFIYPKKEWEAVIEKYRELPNTKEARNFMRFFLSGASFVELDKQGRVNISDPLKEYANLEKECIIIGVNDRLEIWSEERFQNFLTENEEKFSDMADHLFGNTL